MTNHDDSREADGRALQMEFMHQEECSPDVANHIAIRVAEALGIHPSELTARLTALEAETVAAPGQFAGHGIRRARILRGLYDLFTVSLLPQGHATCSAILATTASLQRPPGPGH